MMVPSSSMAFSEFTGFDLGNVANSAAPKVFGAGCAINSGSTGDCPQTGASRRRRRKGGDALRADALR
jgi:hypothetical protein